MLNGAHGILYSKDAEADRAFLRDVLKLTYVDLGHGWLIFGLPPSEIAVHPTDGEGYHELFLMCSDIEGFVREMREHDRECAPVRDAGWGLLSQVSLPGGGKLGVYEPRHPRPEPMGSGTPKGRSGGGRRSKTRPTKKRGKGTARKKVGASRSGSSRDRFRRATLESIRKGKMLRIRAGSEPHRFIGIWAVVVEDRVFVRSWSLKPRGWFRTFQKEPRGTILVDGREMAVRSVLTKSERLKKAIDQAYLEKYDTKGSIKYARDLGRAKSRATTTELVPLPRV